MTLLKSSLFVICAGGERIMRSRIIVEAVTRVIIHYVFLDVVGGVYRMISQNGHQEEDQEGIRLRNNNVVHFVSDGYSNNNNNNNNSKRADDDGDGVTEKMSRYDRLLLIFGLALLTAVIIFQTMAWAVVWAQKPDDSQVISVGSSRAPELGTEEDGSDGDGGVLLVTVDEQEMPEWVVGSPSFLQFYLEKEYDGNVTLQKPIERVVNPLSLIPDEELTNEQEDVLEGLNNWLLASFVINSEEGSERRETALFAYQDPSDEKSTTDGQGIVLHNLEGLI